MRQNPLHYLTDRQIRLLAAAEGLSVAQLLAKYGGIRQRGGASQPAKKRPATSAKRKVARGQVFTNPYPLVRPVPLSLEQTQEIAKNALSAAGESLRSASVRRILARDVKAGKITGDVYVTLQTNMDSLLEAAEPYRSQGYFDDSGWAYVWVSEASPRRRYPEARKNPRTAAQTNASTAMRLYHSGQASSLQEAWDIVKSGRRR